MTQGHLMNHAPLMEQLTRRMEGGGEGLRNPRNSEESFPRSTIFQPATPTCFCEWFFPVALLHLAPPPIAGFSGPDSAQALFIFSAKAQIISPQILLSDYQVLLLLLPHNNPRRLFQNLLMMKKRHHKNHLSRSNGKFNEPWPTLSAGSSLSRKTEWKLRAADGHAQALPKVGWSVV